MSLLEAAENAIAVAQRLMNELNNQVGEEVAPGGEWKEAFQLLKKAVEEEHERLK